jgi:hypothetical protein
VSALRTLTEQREEETYNKRKEERTMRGGRLGSFCTRVERKQLAWGGCLRCGDRCSGYNQMEG